jgi:hypothetical protein
MVAHCFLFVRLQVHESFEARIEEEGDAGPKVVRLEVSSENLQGSRSTSDLKEVADCCDSRFLLLFFQGGLRFASRGSQERHDL